MQKESWLAVKFISIGAGNLISADRLISVVSPDSAPIRRTVQDAKENGNLIDATGGRKTRSVLFFDSGHIVLSYMEVETLSRQLSEDGSPVLPKGND